MARRCVALRHVPVEDLGSFAAPLARRGWTVDYVDAPVAGEAALQAAADASLLVVLGGPIGAAQQRLWPFLAVEQAVLAERIAAGAPTLGICLGAQLMARALGVPIVSGPTEIGWAPLWRDPGLPDDVPAARLFGDRDGIMMLHWHGDTWERLPEGAVRIGRTEAVPEQGFMLGDHAVAWQCHPEFDPAALEAWLVSHAHELGAHGGAERIRRLRAETAAHGARLVDAGRAFLEVWLDRIG